MKIERILFPALAVISLRTGILEIMYPERYLPKKPVTRWEKFYNFFWIVHASETSIRINGVLCVVFALAMALKLLEELKIIR
jgi:hypothetical protein